jgi:hypothetical protein
MKNINHSLTIVILVIILAGCDVFQKDQDVTPTQTVDMYVVQNKAAVIDLNAAFPNFGKVVLPAGKSNVTYFGDRYIKYRSLNGNSDSFNFSVVTASNQKVTAAVNVHTDANTACGQPFTNAKIKKNSKLVVNLFNNPEFCDYDIYSHGGIAIADSRPTDSQKNLDGVLLAVCAGGAEGNSAILSFDPPKGFVGQVIGKYYLGITDSSTSLAQEDYYSPAKFKFYSAHEYTIDVVEE